MRSERRPYGLALRAVVESSLPDLIGRTIGEYEIVKRLGRGGMGIVYEGRQPLIGKRVAVKVLKPRVSDDPALVERFVAEARAVNEIRHRGIVDIFSFGRLPEGPWYCIMELLEGESFEQIIATRAPLPVVEALGWVEEMLDAVEAAHSAQVVHRDIKPSNLFLVNAGRGRPYVKLLDFGIAKLTVPTSQTPHTRGAIVIGTPGYISPEQVLCKPVTPQTDLYALGCVLFELVTGRRVFEGEDPIEVMRMHVEDSPTAPSSLRKGISVDLDDVILWALAKEPADRPSSAAAMREHLFAIKCQIEPTRTFTPPSVIARRSSVSNPAIEVTRLAPLPPLEPDEPPPPLVDQPITDVHPELAQRSLNLPMLLAGLLTVLVFALGALFLAMSEDPPQAERPTQVDGAVKPGRPEVKPEAKVEPERVISPLPAENPPVSPVVPIPSKPHKVDPSSEPSGDQKTVRPGITTAQLQKRLRLLEMQLEAQENKIGQRDSVLRQFLDQARQQIQLATTNAERREAWRFLSQIEGQMKR